MKRICVLTSIASLGLAACSGGDIETPSSGEPTGLPADYHVEDGILYFEGDIEIGPAEEYIGADGRLLIDKAATKFDWSSRGTTGAFGELSPSLAWPAGLVPYYFDSTIPAGDARRANINLAMDIWERNTNINFFEVASNYSGDALRYTDKGTCSCGSSQLGRVGGHQQVKIGSGLGPNASPMYVALHEIGHAIGLIHEHQRSDRGQFITDNVPPDDQVDPLPADTHIRLVEYDIESIMHYATNPGAPTITLIGGGAIPEATTISRRDIRAVQVAYGNQFEPTMVTPTWFGTSTLAPRERGVFYWASLNQGNGNGNLMHKWWNGSSWSTLAIPAGLDGPVSAASDPSGNVHIWGVGSLASGARGSLWHAALNANHQVSANWANFGTPPPAGTRVTGLPWAPAGVEEAYMQVTGGRVFRWSPAGLWQDLGGFAKEPVRAIRAGSSVHVLAVGAADSNLYHKRRDIPNNTWTPSTTGWTVIPGSGYVLGQPSVASCTSDSIEVVVKSWDAQVYYQAWVNGSWRPSWTTLGGIVIGNPEIHCYGANVYVHARSTDGNYYYAVANGGSPGSRSFGSWTSRGKPANFGFTGTPAVSMNPDASGFANWQVFVRGAFNNTYTRGRIASQWDFGFSALSFGDASW